MNELTAQDKKPIHVEVDIDEPVISEAEALEAMKQQGFSQMPVTKLKSLATLGCYMRKIGVLKLQRGQALVNQQMVSEAMGMLQDEMRKAYGLKAKSQNKIKRMCSLAHELGYLSDKLSGSQQVLLEAEQRMRAAPGVQEDDQPQQRFPIGRHVGGQNPGTLIVTEQVNIAGGT